MSRCSIRMRRDFRDGVVCSGCHHGEWLVMEARVFQRTSSDTMEILRKNNLIFSLN